ncbi:putative quinol monooxygenase [Paraburkholderia sp. J94]|uniref:putative quinol monooxygenase n=1 Tax=Paraburkholderia sp. J94 TaxID=2805441 RepID=UPI002AB2E900|nr:antibiotic biosynthesis monooxygenase [Paraburkholderia sp. J94]
MKFTLFAAISSVAAVAIYSNAACATQTGTHTSDAIYAVVHVDIEPPKVPEALPALRAFEAQAKQDPAVASIEVLQQIGAENHFTLVEVLKSKAAYDAFVSRPYVRSLRETLQPILGGPFDERLHHAMP